MGAPNDFGRKYGRYGFRLCAVPMILVGNMTEKMIKNYQIFFSEKYIIKTAQKSSFIKIVNIEPILAYVHDMAQMCNFSTFFS